jgi:hypothetical protein
VSSGGGKDRVIAESRVAGREGWRGARDDSGEENAGASSAEEQPTSVTGLDPRACALLSYGGATRGEDVARANTRDPRIDGLGEVAARYRARTQVRRRDHLRGQYAGKAEVGASGAGGLALAGFWRLKKAIGGCGPHARGSLRSSSFRGPPLTPHPIIVITSQFAPVYLPPRSF